VRMAIRYALDKKLPSVTLMHKGNIMKFTEGAFKDWGYDLARTEFRDRIVTEDEIAKGADGKGKLLIKDRIADSMFQQIQLRPDEYSVIATPNLNGDYLSDAAAAMTGGIGLAAGANIGDRAAMFEATHGTAPRYTGKNMANPGAVLLSGVLRQHSSSTRPWRPPLQKAKRSPARARAASFTLPTILLDSLPVMERRGARRARNLPRGLSRT